MNAEWDFLTMLRDEGRKAADEFLDEHGDEHRQALHPDIDRWSKACEPWAFSAYCSRSDC